MSQGSFDQEIMLLGQKVRRVARSHTDRVATEGTLSRFQDFFLQPIIKDRSSNHIQLRYRVTFHVFHHVKISGRPVHVQRGIRVEISNEAK